LRFSCASIFNVFTVFFVLLVLSILEFLCPPEVPRGRRAVLLSPLPLRAVSTTESITDQQLLREFALTQSQAAFRMLVERHQSMVFGTARRRMHSDHAAADVAQNVFVALARKAAWLSVRTNVGGWLYKSTLMEAARRQRDEARRGQRERHYSEEMNIRGTSDEDTDAPRAADLMPLLDDALAGLSEADREAIVLRFFRGMSLRETGTAMGTTEEAARKRVSRALEKLSVVFKRRGATASAAFIAAAMLPRAAEAAVPAGWAAQVVSSAVALPATGSAGLAFLKVAALSKTQIAVVCLAAAAVPVVHQAATIRRLRSENSRLTAEAAAVRVGSAGAVRADRIEGGGNAGVMAAVPSVSRSGEEPRVQEGHRGNRWAEFWEAERRQQNAARLLAMEERLGLDDNQLAAAAQLAERMDAERRTAFEEARRAGSQPDAAELDRIRLAADDALLSLLSDEQRESFQRFIADEARNRQEVYAGSMLGEMQKSLLLSDEQKDQLFAFFSSLAESRGGDPGPWAWAHIMQDEQSVALKAILTEDQFRLWNDHYQSFSRNFGPRRSPAENGIRQEKRDGGSGQ
jgi:RNA polymerase sigma factor (sigma-70 family)